MLRTRSAALLACATALIATAPAGATGCPFVTDATGDVTLLVPQVKHDEPAFDLVSADLVTDATTITAVVRVADLQPDSGTRVAATYELLYRQGEAVVKLGAANTPTGAAFDGWATPSGSTADEEVRVAATGSVDHVTNEIRVSVSRASFPSYASAAPGTVLSGIQANVFYMGAAAATPFPVPNHVVRVAGSRVDVASTPDTYTAGDAACITP